MFKVSLSKKDYHRVMNYFSRVDKRLTAFYRGFSTHAARLMAIELNEDIAPGQDPLAKEYKDGVRALRISDAAIIPPHDNKIKKRRIRVKEQHYACVAVRAHVATGEELGANKQNVLIKIKAHTRKMRKTPQYIWPLVRYGPWTMDTIPFVPDKDDAIVLYLKTDPAEVKRVAMKNDREQKKVYTLLRLGGASVQKRDTVIQNMRAVEEVEYYALRREFGLISGQKPVWKPIVRRMRQRGPQYVMATNKQLWRSLFDVSYNGYGRLGKFSEISKAEVSSFSSFQDKIG